MSQPRRVPSLSRGKPSASSSSWSSSSCSSHLAHRMHSSQNRAPHHAEIIVPASWRHCPAPGHRRGCGLPCRPHARHAAHPCPCVVMTGCQSIMPQTLLRLHLVICSAQPEASLVARPQRSWATTAPAAETSSAAVPRPAPHAAAQVRWPLAVLDIPGWPPLSHCCAHPECCASASESNAALVTSLASPPRMPTHGSVYS
jgi:hypothetical protein